MKTFAGSPNYITLSGRLKDRFGDNGLVTVMLGRKQADVLHMDLWLMSCRVLKRDMELAMLDTLVERAKAIDVSTILGYYIPTQEKFHGGRSLPDTWLQPQPAKEPMEAPHGFWDVGQYTHRNTHIQVVGMAHE